MFGKSNMETYIAMCKLDSQWEFGVWLRKLKQGLYINLEEWDRGFLCSGTRRPTVDDDTGRRGGF